MAKNTTKKAAPAERASDDPAAVIAGHISAILNHPEKTAVDAQTIAPGVPDDEFYRTEADILARVLAHPEVPIDFTDYMANVIIDIQGDVTLWTPEVLRVAWPLIRNRPGNGGNGLWVAVIEAFRTFADDDTRKLLWKLGDKANEGGVH